MKLLIQQNYHTKRVLRQFISTSEIKVSVVVDEKYLELSVRTLHSAFNLEDSVDLEG